MRESLNKQSYTNAQANTDIKNYEIEKQQDGNTISTLDNQPVNNIFNDEQVRIYGFSTHQNRDTYLLVG